jgi:outer membrane beta-barrel protein
MTKRWLLLLGLVGPAMLSSPSANAADERVKESRADKKAKEAGDRGPKTVAVQNRLHTMRHEYSAWIGSLPMDAFTKGVTFTGAYTLHFSDLLAWEVAEFTYSLPVDTRLQDELNNLPQPVGPTPFEVVQYYGTSNIVFKPVYGKFALLNRSLIYEEMFLEAGAGYGKLTITGRPAVDLGAGMRFYSGRLVSFRLDVRDYLFVTKGDTENELWVAAGISLGLGGGK